MNFLALILIHFLYISNNFFAKMVFQHVQRIFPGRQNPTGNGLNLKREVPEAVGAGLPERIQSSQSRSSSREARKKNVEATR